MTIGFIILRHVNNRTSDFYWKECYKCIRKFYDNPILIVDDSSNKSYLTENIILENTTIIYDTDHKGAGEILPYYYFHKLKPFDQAILFHDTLFIQSKIDLELRADEPVKILWTFPHNYDDEIFDTIQKVTLPLDKSNELIKFYHRKNEWLGCFGGMSNIKWDFLDKLNSNHQLFEKIVETMNNRLHRHAFERVVALLIYYNNLATQSLFGNIYNYCPWGVTFDEYLNEKYNHLPIVKVWVGR